LERTLTGTSLPAASRPSLLHWLAGASLFVGIYVGTFLLLAYAWRLTGMRLPYLGQWSALAGAVVATISTVRIVDRAWSIGFLVAPRLALRELMAGGLFAVVLIGSADLLIMATAGLRHRLGRGLPWLELLVVFIPAAIHEEVLFRGYLFQTLRRIHRLAAIIASSVIFAVLHAGNNYFTLLALGNLMVAGILLALAYERYERLWFPIGLHLLWNLFSGPILGYEVSGYASQMTVLRTYGRGPEWLTGGLFGIEGSIWALAVEGAGIAWLLWTGNRRGVDRGQEQE
jgi:membrane protease YdiL (CAAX protease family)